MRKRGRVGGRERVRKGGGEGRDGGREGGEREREKDGGEWERREGIVVMIVAS